MSPTDSLLNLLLPGKEQPPYNKVAAQLDMTVEVETVQVRDEQSGTLLKPSTRYPHYPLLERKVETVGQGAPPSTPVNSVSGGDGDDEEEEFDHGGYSNVTSSGSSMASSSTGNSVPKKKGKFTSKPKPKPRWSDLADRQEKTSDK